MNCQSLRKIPLVSFLYFILEREQFLYCLCILVCVFCSILTNSSKSTGITPVLRNCIGFLLNTDQCLKQPYVIIVSSYWLYKVFAFIFLCL